MTKRLHQELDDAWRDLCQSEVRRVAETGGAYVRAVDVTGMRAVVSTLHPERAVKAIREHGYADWCSTSIIGDDCVEVCCMDPWRMLEERAK